MRKKNRKRIAYKMDGAEEYFCVDSKPIEVCRLDRATSSVGIKLELPYRINMKDWKPLFKPFAKARKRIETNFSQLCDQFVIFRNHAKQTEGLFTRIIGKISAFTVLQYINYINERPLGKVKYALS